MDNFDVAVIGGGIVGLSTAYQLSARIPDLRIVVLEKEPDLATHQTGHNSGVLHSGIYYKPGSLKATNCREGKEAMQQFCVENGIDFEICGKIIVAVDENELSTLERIFERGQSNGVECRLIDQGELNEMEPHSAGIRAIHVPQAGIVNYRQVCNRLAEIVTNRQGDVRIGNRVTGITQDNEGCVVETGNTEIKARYLVNCAGLHSDRITKMAGGRPSAKIVPFRGEYYELVSEKRYLCKNLIYPVPDPKFPFLGVHFTRMIDGGVECGPNAVLAFAREGYRKTNINLADTLETLSYPGFIRLALKHWRMGCGELWRSLSKRAFVRALQRLMPDISANDLKPAPAGIRAQAVMVDGSLVDDFLIDENERIVNVVNAPSPAATASLNIGKIIANKIVDRL